MEAIKTKIVSLLRYTERYTKTDMVYLVKNSFWLNLNTLISSMLSLAISVAFARYISKDVYGNYQFLISFASIIGTLTLTGMNAAVIQAVARGYEGVLKKSVIVQLKYSIIPFLAGITASIYYFINNNTTLSYSLIAVAVFMPLASALNTWSAFLSGKKDFKKTFIFGQIYNGFYYLLMFVCILKFPQTITLVFVNFSASLIINLFIYLRVSKKSVSNNNEDDDSISYGKKLSLSSILPLISLHIDNVIVFNLLGASNLAIYAFASNVPEKFMSLIRPISTIALPKMSTRNKEELRSELGKKILKLFIFSLAFSLIYIMLAPLTYKILFPTYTESVLYSQFYVIAAAISTTTSFAISFMFASRSNKIYTYNLINPVFNIAIMIIGAYIFGIWGLIASRIIGNGFSLALSYGLEKNLEPNSQ